MQKALTAYRLLHDAQDDLLGKMQAVIEITANELSSLRESFNLNLAELEAHKIELTNRWEYPFSFEKDLIVVIVLTAGKPCRKPSR